VAFDVYMDAYLELYSLQLRSRSDRNTEQKRYGDARDSAEARDSKLRQEHKIQGQMVAEQMVEAE
jgi:hypothetical protein